MTLKIYYDDIDGELIPKLAMLPRQADELLSYSVEGPYERFYQEDFHDDLKLLSVSQGALTSCPFHDHQFDINLEQLKRDLERLEHDPEAVYETDYYVVLVDDLQELLSYDVIGRFS
ncbi:hypothetical protein [Halalkalibacter krulwichiae]|uniref:Uncharacterized protein n=1 Tax=Halalkalibacter krulwichiae TaxID=199441 RepID=A0A1Y9TIA0_9BACI|nr:hypothetical protein [Halalkalibacter krulwichiae]ARK28738.1 hypothetical protein BkAM31D_02125 [Halalkalibacter krulwichiae]